MNLDPYIKSGRLVVQQVDPAEIAPGEFVARARSFVEDDGAAVVIIDSLNGLLNAMPGEEFLLLQLHEMLSYLNQSGVATLMTLAQSGIVGTMSSPVDVSYLADSVLLFRYFEAGGAVRQALSVLKKRTGAHERTIRELSFASDGIRVGRALTDFEGILTGVPRLNTSAEGLKTSGS